MAKSQAPKEASTETGLATSQEPAPAAPEQEAPIQFADPVSVADLTAGVADTPEKAIPAITEEQLAELQRLAGHDNVKRDFLAKVMEARKPPPEEPAPPALAPRMAEQTRLEMEAGRKLNEHHAALAARRTPAPPERNEAEPVFRPADYVPNQRKGQGHVQARTL